jgi:hypothetical protein
LRTGHRRATTIAVAGTGQIEEAAKAWEAVRADQAIQFAPVNVPQKPPPSPGWLDAVLRWLADALEPVGRALGVSWPIFKWVLLALAVAALALLVWRMLAPVLGWRPSPQAAGEEESWTPATGEALALLEDADALAEQGRFDEATHLLLKRSVGQIAAVRPDLVEPATTARELAAIGALPEAARTAFATIATRVEHSLFALRALGADDWQAARVAYADFALSRLVGRG